MALNARDVARSEHHGAVLLTLRDASFPLVQFTLALRQGASSDAPEAQGTLGALLSMLLRGTTYKPRAAFNAALEALGSSIDSAVGHEMAYLHGTALKQNFVATVELLMEALLHPALDAEELHALCEETVQGLVSERDDDDALADLFLRRAYYENHPLHVPATGTVASLQNVTVAGLKEALSHLVAERMVVGVAGDVHQAEAQAAFAPLFAATAHKAPAAVDWPQPAGPDAPRIVLVDKPDRTQVQLRVARQGVHVTHGDSLTFWLGCVAFGGTFTSPLTREVRDVRGWSYFANADFRRKSRFTSPVVLRTAPALGDALPCLALKLTLFDALAAGQLDHETLKLSHAYLLGRLPFHTATAFDVMGQVISLEVMGLHDDVLWKQAERLEAIDLQQVGTVMQRHLASRAVCAVLVGPKEALEPGLRAAYPKAKLNVYRHTDGLTR